MECSLPTEEIWQLRHFGVSPTIEKSSSVIKLSTNGQVSVGRGPKADYFLDSLIYVRLISRIHAVITGERLPNGHMRFTLTNKGLNGTYINDFKLGVTENNSKVLHEGDKVAFGHINCGSIKVGEYAPQSHSEFQFLFERVKSNPESQTCQTEVADTNPFFSPYPSDTPVYSRTPDTSVAPNDSEERGPPSPQCSNNTATEKENNLLKVGRSVHSFDLEEDSHVEEKNRTHLNLLGKSSKQVVEDYSEEELAIRNSSQYFSTAQNSVQKSFPTKVSLPDVIPESVKDCHDDYCHPCVQKELKRSHSLPAHIDDNDDMYSQEISEKVQYEKQSGDLCSNVCCLPSCEGAHVHTSSKDVLYSNGGYSVTENRPSHSPASYMSKKKRYILSMGEDVGLRSSSNLKQFDKESREGKYIDVKTSTLLPQWQDLDSTEGNNYKDKKVPALKDEPKEEGFGQFEENRNFKENVSLVTLQANIELPKSVKSELDETVVEQVTYNQNLSHLKSKKDFKDKADSSENSPPVVTNFEKASEEIKEEEGGSDCDIKNMSPRKLKWDDRVVLSASKERLQRHTSPSKKNQSSSPIVIMEKIPDNIEGKLWKHLKSKENFSTKRKTQSKSSKKHHYHSYHLHHRRHVDHNIQVKQKLMSSRLHSSSSSKSFKSSHSSRAENSSHSKHKKMKSHHSFSNHSVSVTVKPLPVTSEQNAYETPMPKLKAKTKTKDSSLLSDKIDNVSPIKKSISSSSSSSNILASKALHSSKSLTHSPTKKEKTMRVDITSSSLSTHSLPSSKLPQLVKDTCMDINHSNIKARILSTGFLSSDLNSDDEEVRSRENSPPNKKSDIFKRIYSPSRSPKHCDKVDDKPHMTKNPNNDKKLKIVEEHRSQDGGIIDKPILSSCIDNDKEHTSNIISNISDPASNASNANTPALSESSETDKKVFKDCPSSKRRHVSPVKDKRNELKPSKATTTPLTSCSSHSSNSTNTPVSSSVVVNKSLRGKDSLSDTTHVEKRRSKHSSHCSLDGTASESHLSTNENSSYVNKKIEQMNEKKVNEFTSSLKSENERPNNSRKRKNFEENDVKLLTKSKSSKSRPSTANDSTPPKLTKEVLISPSKTKEDKRMLKTGRSVTPTPENSSKTLPNTSSKNQPEPKSSKNQSQNKGEASSLTSSVNGSKQSPFKKNQNLKRQRTLEDDSNMTSSASKKCNESPPDLQAKRARLKCAFVSSSSSDSSSSSSSSSSVQSPSSILFSQNFPPNKSKRNSASNGVSKTKESIFKSASSSKDMKSSMPKAKETRSAPAFKKSNKSPRKSSSKSQVVEDAKLLKPKPSSDTPLSSKKPATPSASKPTKSTDKKYQEMFSWALEASASDRPKQKKVSKGVIKPGFTAESKNVSKKVFQKKDVDPGNENKEVNIKVTRRSTRGLPQPPSSRVKTIKRAAVPALSKAGKKTNVMKKNRKRTSNWSSGSDEDDNKDIDDDEDAVFDIMMKEDESEEGESDWDLEDGVEYCNEPCGAKNCTNPVGPKVDWVMCDGCEGWYHIVCVNTTLDKIAQNGDQFQCGFC